MDKPTLRPPRDYLYDAEAPHRFVARGPVRSTKIKLLLPLRLVSSRRQGPGSYLEDQATTTSSSRRQGPGSFLKILADQS